MDRLRLGINVDRLRLSHRLEAKDYDLCTMHELRRLLMYHNVKGSWNYVKPGLIKGALQLKLTLETLPPSFLDHLLERMSKASGQYYVSDIPLPISVLELFTETQIENVLIRHGYRNTLPTETSSHEIVTSSSSSSSVSSPKKRNTKIKNNSSTTDPSIENGIVDPSDNNTVASTLVVTPHDQPLEEQNLSSSSFFSLSVPFNTVDVHSKLYNNEDENITSTTVSPTPVSSPLPYYSTTNTKYKVLYTSYYSSSMDESSVKTSVLSPSLLHRHKSSYYSQLCYLAMNTYHIQLCHLTLEERKIINPLLQEYNEEIESTVNGVETSPGNVSKLLRFLHISRFRTPVLKYRKNMDIYMKMSAEDVLKKLKSSFTIEAMEEEDKLLSLESEFTPTVGNDIINSSSSNIYDSSSLPRSTMNNSVHDGDTTETEDENDYSVSSPTSKMASSKISTVPYHSSSSPPSKAVGKKLSTSASSLTSSSPSSNSVGVRRIPLDVDHILECQFFGYVVVRTPQMASRIRRLAFRRPLMLMVNSLQAGPLMINDSNEIMVENGPPELLILRPDHEYTNLTITTDLINRCKGQIVYDYVGQCMAAKEDDNKSFITSALNHSIRHPGKEFIHYMVGIVEAMLDVYQPLRADLGELRRGDGFLDTAIFREYAEQFDIDYAAMRLDEQLDDLPRKIQDILDQKLVKKKKPFYWKGKSKTSTTNATTTTTTTNDNPKSSSNVTESPTQSAFTKEQKPKKEKSGTIPVTATTISTSPVPTKIVYSSTEEETDEEYSTIKKVTVTSPSPLVSSLSSSSSSTFSFVPSTSNDNHESVPNKSKQRLTKNSLKTRQSIVEKEQSNISAILTANTTELSVATTTPTG